MRQGVRQGVGQGVGHGVGGLPLRRRRVPSTYEDHVLNQRRRIAHLSTQPTQVPALDSARGRAAHAQRTNATVRSGGASGGLYREKSAEYIERVVYMRVRLGTGRMGCGMWGVGVGRGVGERESWGLACTTLAAA